MKKIILAHYSGEITLKGRNRSWFEGLLVKNIQAAIGKGRITKNFSRIIIEVDAEGIAGVVESLPRVFGISSYAIAFQAAAEMGAILDAVKHLSEGWEKVPVRVETKRADKAFPLPSMEVSKQIGQYFKDNGFPIDLEQPERTVYIEILKHSALVYSEKHPGPGGLPVGSAGRVLCLFSGGIDSPVAAYRMMRRGCTVHYLHVHSLPDNDAVKQSKIVQLVRQLQPYNGPARLHIVPYFDFYKKTFQLDSRYELILFRRFLVRLANAIAKKEGMLGLVTGDSLGQVASQTLENLQAATAVAAFPVYRPLLSYDKQEIVDMAKDIGTYGLSIQEYKDCCSLVAVKNPATKPSLKRIEELEKEIEVEQIVEEAVKKVEVVNV